MFGFTLMTMHNLGTKNHLTGHLAIVRQLKRQEIGRRLFHTKDVRAKNIINHTLQPTS